MHEIHVCHHGRFVAGGLDTSANYEEWPGYDSAESAAAHSLSFEPLWRAEYAVLVERCRHKPEVQTGQDRNRVSAYVLLSYMECPK